MRELLRITDFRLLWLGQATSSLGDAVTSLALLITAQRVSGSVAAVAGTAIAVALPQLLIGLVAGVYVDRWNRKTVMIVSDLLRGLLVLGFLFVVDASHMWLMYVVAFSQAAVGTFFNPARGALMPSIVGEDSLMAANSISESTRIVFGVVGTAVAGVYAGLYGTLAGLFVLDAVTFLVSALLETRIVTSGRPEQVAPAGVWRELKQGLSAVVATRPLVAVLVGAGVAMLGLGAVNVLLVPFVVDDLAVSETWFGAFEGAQVTSMVLAGGLIAALARRLRPGTILAWGLAGAGVMVAAVSTVTEAWHLVLVLFLVGWFITPIQASAQTILQQEIEPSQLGRAGAGFSTISTTANVASMALAGTLAAVLGVRGVFVAAGVVTVAAGALAWTLVREPMPNLLRDPAPAQPGDAQPESV